MLTSQQEIFLASFADKGIADAEAEAKRIADIEATREKDQARADFIAQTEAEKKAELQAAIEAYDQSVNTK